MQQSAEQIQYEKLMSFFKLILNWTVTIFIFLLGIIATFFYSDRQSMDAEKRELIAERTALQVAYNQKVIELGKDIDGLKIKSQETINSTKNDTQEKISILQKTSSDEIKNLKDLASNEISDIKVSASKVANQETAKQVANVFQQGKVKKLLEDKVVKESEGLITEVFQQKSKSLVKINSWMVQFSQGSFYSNRDHIQNFEGWINKEFPDSDDQLTVRRINYQITDNYNSECFLRAVKIINSKTINEYDKDISENDSNKVKIEKLISKINQTDNLYDRCTKIQLISILSGEGSSYRCFDSFRY
jgi:hypothetical protein